ARDFGPLPEHSVRVLADRLATALESVHAAGLIHRDLKPSNVLVTVDGPRVIDFGIARAMDSLAGDSLHTRTGMLIGSPGFMSPEQVRGLDLTPASDVFCLGAVLVYAATGRLLFGAAETGLNAHLFRVAEEEADLTGVPPSLAGLVRDCLHKDPARRPTPAEVSARTATGPNGATGSDGEWLPGTILAQLGRHAAQLLDFSPETRGAASPQPSPDPRVPAQPRHPAQPLSPSQPVPPSPAYTPTTPADRQPSPRVGSSADVSPGTPPPGRWRGLGVAVAAQLLVMMGTASLTTALPYASVDLGAAPRLFAFSTALAFALVLLFGGYLTDRLGRKRVLALGLTGSAVSFALGGLAVSTSAIIWSTALVGACAALVSTAALALVSADFTEPQERGRAFGLYAAAAGGGTAFGAFTEGWLLQAASWRIGMYAIGLLSVVLAIVTAAVVRDRPADAPVRADVPGLLLGTAGLLIAVSGFGFAGEMGWTTPWATVIGLLGVLLLLAFGRRQLRTDHPLVPAHALKEPDRLCAGLALLALGTPLPQLWSYPLGDLLLMALTALLTATQVSARFHHRMDPRALIVPGLVTWALCTALLTSGVVAPLSVLPPMGIALGLALAPLYATATGRIAPRHAGGTSALVLAAPLIGGRFAPGFPGEVVTGYVTVGLTLLAGVLLIKARPART
ncbi:MFS transporter, partial [Streptomyces sp. NPDC056347]|uniref:MFS transporter n=1 Tax=Streptomyces sp. NPDC056347 TaxID=3345790 RepID=UPI0035D818D4